MYKEKDKPILDLIRTTVREIEPDAEIILYGSRARGDARPDSDWDVIVLHNKDILAHNERGIIDYKLWSKGLEMNQEINTKEYTRKEWENAPKTLFKYYVQTEGIKL
ncbi:MAG: nucleotidyltransferase domain-containing protein [Prevotella sp.]|nr:nucleotidyltransferase domain-containing protein [Prevotella sp.]